MDCVELLSHQFSCNKLYSVVLLTQNCRIAWNFFPYGDLTNVSERTFRFIVPAVF